MRGFTFLVCWYMSFDVYFVFLHKGGASATAPPIVGSLV